MPANSGACQKSGVSYLDGELMRSFRTICIALLAVLFVFSTNRCLIGAALPERVDDCCQTEGAPERTPCDTKTCAPCATLESGANRVFLLPVVAPVPEWLSDAAMAEFWRQLLAAIVEEVVVEPPDPATIAAPPWLDGMTKALPVRGPSLVA